MDTIILCCTNSNGWLNWLNLGLAVFAALIAIGYFVRPRLHYAPYIHHGKWKAKVINKNLIFTVKEIKCEIAVSECRSFETAYSLKLQKDTTLMLRKYHHGINNYVFSPRNLINTIHLRLADRPWVNNQRPEYRYLRIR
ncbi:MAG TPA: hypothetical protein PKJ62_06415, partial [Bacteroidia bacterium]|nr:hypothetical protein [Bacteroidia bacterium]